MIPPDAGTKSKPVSLEQTQINNKRLQYEDSLRNDYLSTFMKENEAKTIITENLTPEQVWRFIHKSEGNYEEIKNFIEENGKKSEGLWVYEFLNALSDKDLRDAPADILQDHVTRYHPEKYPFNVYEKGILPARIANEGLRKWRSYLHDNLSKELKNNSVQQVIHWIDEHILVLPNDNYYRAPISPKGVYDLKLTDKHSLNIFFVAACRAIDIPAYLDGASNQLFVYENEKWVTVSLEKNIGDEPSTHYQPLANTPDGTLVLHPPTKKLLNPEYYVHYTLAKFEDGDFVSFDFEDDPRVAHLPATLTLPPGYYMLSTGNRYSDGETLSQLEFFNIEPAQTVHKTITLRELTPREREYGVIDLKTAVSILGTPNLLSELIIDKELIVCFIDPAREPTRHLFKEFAQLKRAFENWNGKILFLIPEEKQSTAFNPKIQEFPKNSIFTVDEKSQFLKTLLSSTNQEFRDDYPLVFILNQEGKLVFKSEGYRIGLGELLLKSLK